MKIREAGIEDIKILVEYRKQFLNEVYKEELPPCFDTNMSEYLTKLYKKEAFVSFLAEKDNTVISVVMMSIIQYPPKLGGEVRNIGYVFNVYTLPQYRGQGIGAKLLDKVIEKGKHAKLTQIQLQAQQKAESLYLRAGFKNDKEYMVLK